MGNKYLEGTFGVDSLGLSPEMRDRKVWIGDMVM